MTNNSLAQQAHDLLEAQKREWEVLRAGYEALNAVQTRTIEFDGFSFRLQFNPRRIVSSAAKVDAKSIAERKCFLCPANLPKEQRGAAFGDQYLVLGNPFPIFPEHFTIPKSAHTPQRIGESFPDMLALAKAMQEKYTIFYNGPKCGASAPDHFHFQAGDFGFMPVDTEFDRLKKTMAREIQPGVYAFEKYLRKMIAIESSDANEVVKVFDSIYRSMRELHPNEDEPMMNVLAWHGLPAHEKKSSRVSSPCPVYRVFIFPRAKHRPSFYFAEGDEKILLSPASVDFGGVCITPIERDFHRLTKDHLIQMFEEVSLSDEMFTRMCERIAP